VFEDTMKRFKVHKEELRVDLEIQVANSVEDMRLALMSRSFFVGRAHEAAAFSVICDVGGKGGQDEYEKGARLIGENDADFDKLRSQASIPDGSLPSRIEFMTRLDRTIDSLLKSNTRIQKQLEQIQSNVGDIAYVVNQTQGLVSALAEGPHTRIVDEVIVFVYVKNPN
jgi:hypothetical protein